MASDVRPTLSAFVRSVENDQDRWLFFLKENGEAQLPDMRTHTTNMVEGIYRSLYWDSIGDIAKASVRGCTDCIRRELARSH